MYDHSPLKGVGGAEEEEEEEEEQQQEGPPPPPPPPSLMSQTSCRSSHNRSSVPKGLSPVQVVAPPPPPPLPQPGRDGYKPCMAPPSLQPSVPSSRTMYLHHSVPFPCCRCCSLFYNYSAGFCPLWSYPRHVLVISFLAIGTQPHPFAALHRDQLVSARHITLQCVCMCSRDVIAWF